MLNVSIALISFAATCIVIHALLPVPYIRQVRAKLDYLERKQSRFDTLLIGSSRIGRGIEASHFDRLLSDADVNWRSFNFGIDGMTPPETFFWLRKILAMQPKALKRVIIETGGIKSAVNEKHLRTMRASYWHDFRHTWIALRSSRSKHARGGDDGADELLDAERPVKPSGAFRNVLTHLSLMARNYSNVGRAVDWWQNTFRKEKDVLGKTRDGFIPMPQSPMKGARLDDFEKVLAHLRREEKEPESDALAEAEFIRIAQEARARQIEVILLTPPGRMKSVVFVHGGPIPVFSFNDPDAYPELYAVENRADPFHLNAKGAAVFTGLFAHEVARWLKQRAPRP